MLECRTRSPPLIIQIITSMSSPISCRYFYFVILVQFLKFSNFSNTFQFVSSFSRNISPLIRSNFDMSGSKIVVFSGRVGSIRSVFPDASIHGKCYGTRGLCCGFRTLEQSEKRRMEEHAGRQVGSFFFFYLSRLFC